MLMQALIVRSTFLFFDILSAQAGYTSTAHPPATWTNNDFNLNRSYNPDNSLVRVILSLPLPGLGNDRSTGPATIVCGFFCNQIDQLDCDSFLFSVVMLHSYSVNYSFSSSSFPAQVVWSANRDRPVGENATLSLKEDSNLILMDADGTPVWSTNTMGKSVVGMRVTENGRLVLFGNKSVSVWDSSDYPTDSWLLGQSLRKGQRLIANVSATDWSRGSFYLDVVTGGGGVEAYMDSDPPQLYYHYSFPHPKSNYVIFNNESIGGDPYLESIYLHGTSSVQFMRLESGGHLRHYAWKIDGWNLLDDVFSDLDDCAYPMVCGEYGFCSDGECSCPDFTYFRLVDERQLNLGWDPITPLSCDSTKKDHLLPLANASYFNYNDLDAAIFQSTNEEQCKQACLRNCSCKAVFFKFTEDRSNGSCYLPSQVYSVMNNKPELSRYNSSAYIKAQIQNKRTRVAVILGVTLAVFFAAALVTGCVILRIKRKITLVVDNEDNFELAHGLPTRFSFEELKVATENFTRKLGQGGFGSVFEGMLNGEKVAVKRLDGVGQGIKEFLAEVKTIGNVHHINLVRLIGFCSEKSYRLQVYEYMSNGSLDKWIFNRTEDVSLDWKTGLQIITGVAKGLSYLHEDCRKRIAHLDIKPQNILLDEEFHAKVSDFGLSKLIDKEQSHVVTTMRGTRGYLAPEWLTSKITEKADVYSFGVVVIEILCRRKNLDYSQPEECIHLVSLIQENAKENRLLDLVDNRSNDMQLHGNEIMEMMKLAIWCLQNASSRRPSMATVVKALEGSVNVDTSVDYNLTCPAPQVHENGNGYGGSVPPSASLLSGGR